MSSREQGARARAGIANRQRPRSGSPTRWAVNLALAASLTLLGGCMTPQGCAVMTRPEPVEKAKFKLGKGLLLVLVEQEVNSTPEPEMRRELFNELCKQLRDNKANSQIIPDDQVRRMQRTRPTSARWTEAELARALNAEQVLAVRLDAYVQAGDLLDPMSRSRLAAHVRVIDAKSGDLLWPLEVEGTEVVFELEIGEIPSAEVGPRLRRSLGKGLGLRIAQLFYKHKISEREQNLRDFERGKL